MPNIERRANVWYATLHVPPDARPKLGKSKFFQSLKTTDKRTAESRAAVIVAGWKAEIEHARTGSTDPFIDAALTWRKDYENTEHPEVVRDFIEDEAKKIVETQGERAGAAFYAVAIGNQTPLSTIIPKWKAGLQLEAKTIDQMDRDVRRMAEHFQTVEGITRKSVRAWLDELATGDKKLSPSSIRRIVGFCRNFWRYLRETHEVLEEEDSPFVVPSFAKDSKKNKSAAKGSWLPFQPADVMKLHKAAIDKEDQQLADLILLGAYSGARIEELCSLKVADVGDDHFRISDAKTEAGNRCVRIHSALLETIQRLKATRKPDVETGADDGYLLSGLTFNKFDDRSNAIGKRFGRLKKAAGYSDKHVFHSIRKTVVTLLENAGVSENLTADIVGHDKPRITYGLYSGGASLAVMREALEKIKYPDAV